MKNRLRHVSPPLSYGCATIMLKSGIFELIGIYAGVLENQERAGLQGKIRAAKGHGTWLLHSWVESESEKARKSCPRG
jgi:hypothetical protein